MCQILPSQEKWLNRPQKGWQWVLLSPHSSAPWFWITFCILHPSASAPVEVNRIKSGFIILMNNSNSNLTFIALNLHSQQDNSNMQIQSPGTEVGRHHREAMRENELRRISFCIDIGFELLSKRGNSGWCTNVFRKWIPNSGSIKGKTETKLLSGLVNFRLKFWYINEIGNTLTTSSIVSIVVHG